MDNETPTPAPETDHVRPMNIEEEMRTSYIDYSMSVIVGRALPDARDGLKPVHRRILYAMHTEGLHYNRRYSKCAGVVGEVLKKYHPHGDSAVYDALVRLAQDWNLRYPLIDGQGNFGSIDGDSAAAYRYTECRLERLSDDLLADIDKETVDWAKNFDGQTEEPTVLPTRFPCLLVNGSSGIAVGMATNIPPHNMAETVDAIVHQIDNPNCSINDLMQFLKGPDFPTGGIICGTAAIESLYKTGRGQMRVRGRASIEEGKQGKETIIITEIPYTVNKTSLIETIAGLVQTKVLEGISDIRDESNNKEGIRIVIELKRGVVPKVILNNIYKHTQLQTTFGGIMLAIDHGKPKVMNLKELIHCFTQHRFEVITRRAQFDLKKAEARAHILEGLKIALDNLDVVVKIIRGAKNREEAKATLMSRLGLTAIQTDAILDMRLYQLTGLERQKIDEEYLELIKLISYLRDLLASESKIFGVIKTELLDLKTRYGDRRRTDIAPAEGEMNIEDLVADRGCIITISHTGYIKRVPIDTYKAQRRGGKGVSGMATKEEDYVQHLFVANTHDTILFFTGGGRVYWEKVYEIPEASRTARGKAIVNMLNIKDTEKVAAMIRVREFSESEHLVMASAKGVVKKTCLADFKNIRKDGIIAINVDAGDELIQVKLTHGKDELILTTRKGMSVRFSETQLRDQGRATRGVKGIRLKGADRVESMEAVDNNATFLVCTENGYGKRTSFDEYRLQRRGGSGIIAIRTSERNGLVVGAHAVLETDALMLITEKGMTIRINVSDVRVIGRATQGVRLINLEKGDKLVSATTVEPEDETLLDQPPTV